MTSPSLWAPDWGRDVAVTQLPAQTPPPPEPELPGEAASQSWREKLNSIGSGRLRGGAGEGGSLVSNGYPVINLVSPAIIEAQEARRLRRRFMWAGLAVIVVVVAGWLLINQMNSGASSDAQLASAQLTAKSHELGQLRAITGINDVLDKNQKDISTQLQTEAYSSRVISQFLHDIPAGVQLNNYTMQMLTLSDIKAQPGAGSVDARNPCGSAANPFADQRMIGCIRFQGQAITYDLALRLNKYINGTYLAQAYVGDVTATAQGWTFNGSVAVTPEALSGRYVDGEKLKQGLIDGTIPGAPAATNSANPAPTP